MSWNALQSTVIYCLIGASVAGCGHSVPKDNLKSPPAQPVAVEFEELTIAPESSRPLDSLLPERAKELSGTRVGIVGYFHIGSSRDDVQEFTLVHNYTQNTPTYELDELVIVHLRNGVSARATYNQITVEGTFDIEPLQSAGELIAVYHLRDAIIAKADGPSGVAP